MSRKQVILDRFENASEQEQTVMLSVVESILYGLLARQQEQKQQQQQPVESAPVLDRDVWGEIEELL